jgi:hypothetical protein
VGVFVFHAKPVKRNALRKRRFFCRARVTDRDSILKQPSQILRGSFIGAAPSFLFFLSPQRGVERTDLGLARDRKEKPGAKTLVQGMPHRSRIVYRRRAAIPVFLLPKGEWSAGRRQSVCETLLTEPANSAGTLARRSASPKVRERRRLRALHPLRRDIAAAGVFVEMNIFLIGEKSSFIEGRFLLSCPLLFLVVITGRQTSREPGRAADVCLTR